LAFVCSYCLLALPDGRRSVEHPLPQALGGQGWSTPDVCDTCNRRAGREVDQPFGSETMILARRHHHRIPDPRGVVPKAPGLHGVDADGVRVVAELHRDGVRTRRIATAVHRDATSERYVVDQGDGQAILEKRLDRLRKRLGDGYQVTGRIETTRSTSVASVPLTLDAHLWPRLGAKLALAFGREALGKTWLSGPRAAQLRDVLWRRGDHAPWQLGLDPVAKVVAADDPLAPLLPAPQHVVWLQRTRASTVMVVHLFGELRYGVDLCTAPPSGRFEPTWVFDPIARTARTTTLSDLVMEAIAAGRYGDRTPNVAIDG
jgi:hypothetical protein